jgi:tetratricopeptide (TPR) repeat protein
MQLLRRLYRPVALVTFGVWVSGCAGHAARTAEARSALDAMQPKRALDLLDEELDAPSAGELPANVSGDRALLVLDRAMVLQQLDRHALASKNFEAADKAIEILDFSRSAVDELGKYLFSDESGPYKAPAYEKLFINSMNMLSYLTRGDLSGARVEARRFSVMRKFIVEHQDPSLSLLGPGSYFAGFVSEKSGDPQEALRYYDEALAHGNYHTLVEPVRRLAAQAAYRTPRLRRMIGEEPAQKPSDGMSPVGTEPSGSGVPPDDTGELLVVVSFGRVPAKFAQRVPIGLALTYASGALSPYDHDQANRLALQGLVTWVNYPELGRPRGTFQEPVFHVGGRRQALEGLVAVDREAQQAWEQARGSVVASAITRMVARVVAGHAAQKAAGDGVLGLLLNLGTQATLTAVDTPDTRSWSTLPARIAVGRLRLHPGVYPVRLSASGWEKTQQVKIQPGGWTVVVLTALA